MPSLAERFPEAERTLRDRIEDLIVPSEEAVQTAVDEDEAGHCWVRITCLMVNFVQEAAFAAEDLVSPGFTLLTWTDRVIEELDRRLRERSKSSWS